MIKWLFFDYRQFEAVEGFTRRLEPPRKHPEPLLVSDQPWENNALGMYGSVVRRPDGGWQMWYTCGGWSADGLKVACAESADGVEWRRPELDVHEWEGRPTNVVIPDRVFGTAVIRDEREGRPDWRYKLICAPDPHHRISAFRSPDGVHWKPAAENPVIGTNPDCPMCLMRDAEGRYVAYHRPCWGDRRVARSESWDFVHWSEPKVVFEPDQDDPAQVQFYGMGSIPYGGYEIGTLWVYRTDRDDMCWSKGLGVLEAEFVHSRGGYAWHRTAQGKPWIALEEDEDDFGSGQVHVATQPVLLEDEIRYYYAAGKTRHGEDRPVPGGPPQWAIRMASCKPDRFVSVACGDAGRILTRPFWVETAEFFVNADIAPGGGLRAEVMDQENPWAKTARQVPGFTMEDSVPVTGDSCRHVLRWRGDPDHPALANREVRLRIEAKDAKVYSISAGSVEEAARYWDFRLPYFLPMALEKYDRPRQ